MRLDLTLTEIKECRHGVHVWPRNDVVIGRALREWGEFAEGENRLMARYLAPGDVALDVGANVGTTVLPMARHVGPTGQVIAFEPQPLVAHCLASMLVLNNLSNTRVMTLAASDQRGSTYMNFNSDTKRANHGAAKLAAAGTMVPTITLDSLGLKRCNLIKIDVEGHEYAVLRGAKQLITTCAPVIYFEAKDTPETQGCIADLMAQGYRLFWHFAFYFCTDNFRASNDRLFARAGDMNILAVSQGASAPDDLPEITDAQENWRVIYPAFFKTRGLAMP